MFLKPALGWKHLRSPHGPSGSQKKCPFLCFSWGWPCSPNSPQWLPWPHHGPVNVNCCWQQHCGLRIKEGPLIGQGKGATPLPRSLVDLYTNFYIQRFAELSSPRRPLTIMLHQRLSNSSPPHFISLMALITTWNSLSVFLVSPTSAI